jgi:hypothetical protein
MGLLDNFHIRSKLMKNNEYTHKDEACERGPEGREERRRVDELLREQMRRYEQDLRELADA